MKRPYNRFLTDCLSAPAVCQEEQTLWSWYCHRIKSKSFSHSMSTLFVLYCVDRRAGVDSNRTPSEPCPGGTMRKYKLLTAGGSANLSFVMKKEQLMNTVS